MMPPIAATSSIDHTRSGSIPRRFASRVASHAAAIAATAKMIPYQWMAMGPMRKATGSMNMRADSTRSPNRGPLDVLPAARCAAYGSRHPSHEEVPP